MVIIGSKWPETRSVPKVKKIAVSSSQHQHRPLQPSGHKSDHEFCTGVKGRTGVMNIPTTDGTRSVVAVQITFQSCAGVISDPTLKGWRYEKCGHVYWELRRFLDLHTADNAKPTQCKKWCKVMTDELAELLRSHGDLLLDDFLIPSLRAVSFRPLDDPLRDSPYVRDEYSMKTLLVLDWLITSLVTRHKATAKINSTKILQGMLERLLELDDSLLECVADTCATEATVCKVEPDSEGYCIHMHLALRGWNIESFSWSDLVKMLASLYQPSCPACIAAYDRLITKMASMIDIAVEHFVPTRQELLRMPPSEPPAGGPVLGRKRRVDEDVKATITTELTKLRKVHSGSQFLKATESSTACSGSLWERKFVGQHISSSSRLLTCAGVCGITYDAAKSGKPAEDTTHFIFFDAEANLRSLLPLQVKTK